MSREIKPYQSLDAMRAAHKDMLRYRRKYGDAAELLDKAAAFLLAGQAAGAYLNADDERWEAQNLLDFWSNVLHHAAVSHPDPRLAEFDPSLSPELEGALAPYRGLDAFQEVHQGLFFGREALIEQMLDRLQTTTLLAITGPSGSGKSSLLLAGVLPRLRQGALPGSQGWRYYPRMVPGGDPLASLAALLAPPDAPADGSWQQALAAGMRADGGHLTKALTSLGPGPAALVIDQFEETFALNKDEASQAAFLENLLGLVSQAEPQHVLLLTMRTDFETSLARFPRFQAAFRRGQAELSALNAEQLRAAILKPAELVGLKFEEGLVNQLLNDILGEPAALPLLQFTLLRLWDNRERSLVTWDAYRRLGGGRRALALSADDVFESLSPEEQAIARSIFLRIVRPGEGFEVTSSRILRENLYVSGEARAPVDQVLERLVKERLLRLTSGKTPAEDQVEVAHEALIRNWPRLVDWLDEERVSIRRRLRLTAAVANWLALKEDPSALWRGQPLAEALEYRDLNAQETRFLSISKQAVEEEEQERETAHQRELAQLKQLSEEQAATTRQQSRAARILGSLSLGLAVLFVLAVLATIFGFNRSLAAAEFAQLANQRAATAQVAQATALEEGRLADAQALQAAQARATAQAIQAEAEAAQKAESDAQGQAQAAQAAAITSREEVIRLTRLGQARVLASSAAASLYTNSQNSLALALQSIQTTASDGFVLPEAEASLRQAVRNTQIQLSFNAHQALINQVSFSPDGRQILTAAEDGTATVWDSVTGQALVTVSTPGEVIYRAIFHPDGQRLATISSRRILIWNARTGQLEQTVEDDQQDLPGYSRGLAFSPDGSRLAALAPANNGAFLWVWELASGRRLVNLYLTTRYLELSLEYAPDSQSLVTASAVTQVRTANGGERQPPILGHETGVTAVQYSPSGEFLATAGFDGTVRLWRAWNGDQLFRLDHDSPVYAIAFSPDGAVIASGTQNGGLYLWAASTGRNLIDTQTGNGAIRSLDFNQDGSRLAIAFTNGVLQVQEAGSGVLVRQEALAFAFPPADGQIAIAQRDNALRVFDIASGIAGQTLSDLSSPVSVIAYSRDGRLLATGRENNQTQVYNAASGQLLYTVFGHRSRISDAAFNFDGSLIATAGPDGRVRIWRARDGRAEAELQQPVTRIDFHPARNLLAIGGLDGSLTLWNADTQTIERRLAAHEGVASQAAFTPDGAWLVSAGTDGKVIRWDTTTWEAGAAFQLSDALGNPLSVTALAISLDSARLAVGRPDRSILILDLLTLTPQQEIAGFTADLRQLAFSRDGRRLAVLTRENVVYMEPITLEDLIELARSLQITR
jgi:WD40 repeat protein